MMKIRCLANPLPRTSAGKDLLVVNHQAVRVNELLSGVHFEHVPLLDKIFPQKTTYIWNSEAWLSVSDMSADTNY